jgi:phosphate transport system substrate-binding protein
MASSRKLSSHEVATFTSRFGYAPMEIPIAREAVAVYVHRDNPIVGLTLDQVDAIFSETCRRTGGPAITQWDQLGLPEAWKGAAIHLLGRDDRSGTRAFFKEEVLLNGEFRSTLKEAPGSASLILDVGKDPLTIGYSGIGFHSSLVRSVPLAVSSGYPFVSPDAVTAADGTYPLTRLLYLYVNKRPGDDLSPALLEFLRFANSREGQEAIVRAGVYSLSHEDVRRNLSLLADRRTTAPGDAGLLR